MTKKLYQDAGELGERTGRPQIPKASADELAALGLYAGMDSYLVDWEAAVIRRETELMDQLLAHYKLTRDDPTCWEQLALALARAHVPAFQGASSPGRPRKFGPKEEKRSRGAPRKWSLQDDKNLLADLAFGKEILRKQGRKVTNVKALEAAYLVFFAADLGQRETRREVLELARTDAKRVSTAKKTLQKINK
jgi:hypothetical protein